MGNYIKIESAEEVELKNKLAERHDPEAERIKRYLAMPDLSRTDGSPLFEIVERVKKVAILEKFDSIEIPEIIATNILFDLFDFPSDHPARSKSDTYYVDEKNVLRTHDTVMWYYYLNLPEVKKKIENQESLGVLCYGKVYRKDEIDRKHMNVFHQIGGLYLQADTKGIVPVDELKNVLDKVVRGVLGEDTKYRFLEDTFPYTDPSIQVEVDLNGQWVEILGGGMPKKSVLKKMGLEGYNGWAFGFGFERLAIISMELPDIRLLWSDDPRVKKQLKLGNKFKEVSKYPTIVRDISFVVASDFVPNNYFDLIRDLAGDLVVEMQLLDKYENVEKFGEGRTSYTYRIVYGSMERTLTSEEVDKIQADIYKRTAEVFGVELR
ncbi:MAG TPA: hypothetical protein VJH71_02000 [Candidatus Paceibacterota bacterium]